MKNNDFIVFKIKKRIAILFLILGNNTYAQSAKVTYSIKVDPSVEKNAPNHIKGMISEMINEANNQKIDLFIANNEAAFLHQNNTLSTNDEKMIKIAKSAFSSSNDMFISFIGKKIIERDENNILIESTLHKLNWSITNESKKINGYTCYKATLSDTTLKINNIVAWFCPELPYKYGPKFYNGLPGLILELKEFQTTYFATKIELNKVYNKIIFPKGKTISKEEYDKKLKQQMGM